MKTKSLRARVLIPLTAVLFILILAFLISFYQQQQKQIHDASIDEFNAVRDLFRASLANDSNMLAAALELISHDELTLKALKEKDTQYLLARNTDIFLKLNTKNQVTHFYFTGPDRVNILRVHKPEKSGDTINRFTTLEAEKTGQLAHGIELGPLGTFTLRVVKPCFDGGELIGYIELGEEINHIIEKIHDIIGVELYVLIEKEYLQQQGWESGMKMLGRKADWSRFPNVVLVDQTIDAFPRFLIDFLTQKQDVSLVGLIDSSLNGRQYQSTFFRLQDAGGRWVGDMVALRDITEAMAGLYKTSLLAVIICVLTGSLLFAFFFVFMGRIEKQLAKAAEELRFLAENDSLTNVANRRLFDATLQQEWHRAKRRRESLSLIMCDIDFFKKYNDKYGHQAGDKCLSRVASSLTGEMRRAGDFVARYGGEEFVVILPNTDSAGGLRMAERLRQSVAEQHIPHADSKVSNIVTISLGIATANPAEETLPVNLIRQADKALYMAKKEGRNRVAQ